MLFDLIITKYLNTLCINRCQLSHNYLVITSFKLEWNKKIPSDLYIKLYFENYARVAILFISNHSLIFWIFMLNCFYYFFILSNISWNPSLWSRKYLNVTLHAEGLDFQLLWWWRLIHHQFLSKPNFLSTDGQGTIARKT